MEHKTLIDYLAMQQLSGSQLTRAIVSDNLFNWKQFKYSLDNGYEPRTETRIGTATHSLAEVGSTEAFEAMFAIMPDFAHDPRNVTNGRTLKSGEVKDQKPSTSSTTKWVQDQEKQWIATLGDQGKEVLKRKHYNRALRMLEAIQANEEAAELITHAIKEVTVTGTISDVEMRGRIDGITGDCFWDLKTSGDITPRGFGRTAANLRYRLKMAIYLRLLEANGQKPKECKFISVLNSTPNEKTGQYNEPAECVVYNVPIIAIEDKLPQLEQLLIGYKHCLANDWWPGLPNDELWVPNWDMGTEEQIDWSTIE